MQKDRDFLCPFDFRLLNRGSAQAVIFPFKNVQRKYAIFASFSKTKYAIFA